jgi:ATP-binding cassette subfamily B (MDR/TAP) protein 1
VLEDFNLLIPAGEKIALVGTSGSGKSTLVHLIQRFYLPVAGQVLLDGHDISTLNLCWLRQQISVVSQEPMLFGTTIFSNIQQGLIGTKFEHELSANQHGLVINAAKMSNAHDFILKLPQGYETYVGERGTLLSGGQKQRIAIARAIVSDPKILILDEATSALDTTSEEVVQAALEKVSTGRTTITIAHRLSTIRTADNIVVMAHGRVIEQGTHDSLIHKKNVYYQLVQAQSIAIIPEIFEHPTRLLDTDTLSTESFEKAESGPNRSMIQHPGTLKPGQKKKLQYSLWTLIKLIGSYNKEEMHIMIFSLCCSIICGCGNPTQSVLLAEQIVALSLPPSMFTKLRHDANF